MAYIRTDGKALALAAQMLTKRDPVPYILRQVRILRSNSIQYTLFDAL